MDFVTVAELPRHPKEDRPVTATAAVVALEDYHQLCLNQVNRDLFAQLSNLFVSLRHFTFCNCPLGREESMCTHCCLRSTRGQELRTV